MPVTATRLTPHFAARIDGADISQPVDPATWTAIRAALDAHSVLVFHRARLDDDAQIAFSRQFGALEVTRSINPAAGTPFARQSNLDIKTGDVIPSDDRRMIYQLANMLWHSDSSFKEVPSLCSRRAENALVVHDFSWSRDQVRPGFFTDKERGEYPPVRHPLVRTNPVTGEKSLFLGAHASHVVGLPIDDGRAFLKELLAHVTQVQFCYRHAWKEDDLVIWDNRCVLHRATPFDATSHKRFMQRTTVAGNPAELATMVQ